jgi:uncharacterized membrane protein YphA (DoxX/SURF4 family)
MKTDSTTEKIYLFLRLGVAMCFIGHGAFGIITKPVWCNYFAVFGIGHDMAYRLMPVVGIFDIICGITMLVLPIRAVACWLVIWGLITASLRPLSGEPFAEFIERAGNFGVPAALLTLCGGFHKLKNNLFRKIDPPEVLDSEKRQIYSCLRITVFLLLLGHGWLNLIEKPGLMNQYKTLGLDAATIAHYSGIFEMSAACSILIFPYRPLILAILVWKISSELFYPHYELFEWIERGGSFVAILTFWYCQEWKSQTRPKNLLSQLWLL